jgi:hypothetical protein
MVISIIVLMVLFLIKVNLMNKDEQERPLEVFIRLGKSGTLENLLLDYDLLGD